MAGSQQIVRLDREALSELPPELLDLCMRRLPKLIEQHDIIALSDYAKGFLSDKLLRCVIGLAAEHAKAVIIDPKGTNFQKYRGATWIKPNEKEAYEAAGLDSDEDINVVAARLIEGLGGAQLMITRSAKGISVFPASGERKDFSVHVREVVDVTGAGDTVLAVLTMALAQGSCIATSARLANIAAGLAIETVGCARISSTDIRQRLLQLQDMLSLQG
jgi:D-beta-D-heptose 7-phosphate kinase/D-beta-D-heptose 1-phosphate adenosyltransferase